MDELLDRISSYELTEWVAFYKQRHFEAEQQAKKQKAKGGRRR